MKKFFCVIYDTNFIKDTLEKDPNIYGLIFSKSNTSNEIRVWELSPTIFAPFINQITVNDNNVKWTYVDETNPAIFEHPNGANPPDAEHNLQFHDTNPDFVLFSRENLLAILRKSDDGCLYISGARIDYGLGRNDFRDESKNTAYPTLKAETKFTYTEKDKDEVYWNVDIGLPCPILWDGEVAAVLRKVKAAESNETRNFHKDMTVKETLNKMINKLNGV